MPSGEVDGVVGVVDEGVEGVEYEAMLIALPLLSPAFLGVGIGVTVPLVVPLSVPDTHTP